MMRAMMSALAFLVLLAPSVSWANGFELGNGGSSGLLGPYLPGGFSWSFGRGPAGSGSSAAAGMRVTIAPPLLREVIRSLFELRQQVSRETGWTDIVEPRLGDFQGIERLVPGRDGVNRLEARVFWPSGGYLPATILDCRQCRSSAAYYQLRTGVEQYWNEHGEDR